MGLAARAAMKAGGRRFMTHEATIPQQCNTVAFHLLTHCRALVGVLTAQSLAEAAAAIIQELSFEDADRDFASFAEDNFGRFQQRLLEKSRASRFHAAHGHTHERAYHPHDAPPTLPQTMPTVDQPAFSIIVRNAFFSFSVEQIQQTDPGCWLQ